MNATTQNHAADNIIYKVIQLACLAVFTSFFIIGFAEPKYSTKDGLSFNVHEPSSEAVFAYCGTSAAILGLKGIAKTVANTVGAQ